MRRPGAVLGQRGGGTACRGKNGGSSRRPGRNAIDILGVRILAHFFHRWDSDRIKKDGDAGRDGKASQKSANDENDHYIILRIKNGDSILIDKIGREM